MTEPEKSYIAGQSMSIYPDLVSVTYIQDIDSSTCKLVEIFNLFHYGNIPRVYLIVISIKNDNMLFKFLSDNS